VGGEELNINAQVDSFLYRARELGITVDSLYDPRGHHNLAGARSFLPTIRDWLTVRLTPFGPDARLVPKP